MNRKKKKVPTFHNFKVTRPKTPEKVRIVFDCAAVCDKVDKLIFFIGLLLKFRQEKIGFSADIADMFH